MGKQVEITTSAAPSVAVDAFRSAFFTQSTTADYLRFWDRQAIFRRQNSWRQVTESGMLIAAELTAVRGAAERMANAQAGGTLSGIRIGLAAEQGEAGTTAVLAMTKGRSFLGRGRGMAATVRAW